MPSQLSILSKLIGAVGDAASSTASAVGGAVSRASQVASDYNDAANQKLEHLMGYEPNPEDKWKAYPSYFRNEPGNDFWQQAYTRNVLGRYSPDSLPAQMPNKVAGYRADPTGKFGGSDGLETQPTKLDAPRLYAFVRGLSEAKKYGVPQLNAQQLAALALKEGMESFGSRSFDKNNPESVAKFNSLTKAGLNSEVANFATLIAEKHDAAQRTGLPFTQLWNGSLDYAKNFHHFLSAAQSNKNAPLVSFIQTALNQGKQK